MATDKLILLNNQIKTTPPQLKRFRFMKNNFFDYLTINTFLLQNQPTSKHIDIYDITHNLEYPNHTIFFINDHINRIGENPFIGKQQFFNIDFINIENLYLQNKTGITTTCYGNRYAIRNTTAEFPSTYIANIATLAHIHEYTITGHLINQI